MGKITVVTQILLKGRLFRINEQYCFTEKIKLLVGCGCGGKQKEEKWYYRLFLNNVFYDMPIEFATEVPSDFNSPDQCPDPNFDQRRENIGETQSTKDFNPFRQNNDPTAIWCRAQRVIM